MVVAPATTLAAATPLTVTDTMAPATKFPVRDAPFVPPTDTADAVTVGVANVTVAGWEKPRDGSTSLTGSVPPTGRADTSSVAVVPATVGVYRRPAISTVVPAGMAPALVLIWRLDPARTGMMVGAALTTTGQLHKARTPFTVSCIWGFGSSATRKSVKMGKDINVVRLSADKIVYVAAALTTLVPVEKPVGVRAVEPTSMEDASADAYQSSHTQSTPPSMLATR
mmetsp:Transcript_4311/g.10613  ORF Transcript_4311/g.10613 Transcript_4311/m.10613 type:complete len:225 (+) Transcript_4311:8396-9070(+)